LKKLEIKFFKTLQDFSRSFEKQELKRLRHLFPTFYLNAFVDWVPYMLVRVPLGEICGISPVLRP
jgi:hypothetical protein